MMYLWPQAGSMRGKHRRFGVITTAAHRCVPAGIKEGRLWAFDNECFRRPFDSDRWLTHWRRLFPYSKRCLFVVVPDRPFDARETLALWRHWHNKLRRQLNRFDNLAHVRKPWLGLAFAAQDGQESLPLPDEADWVFIAGELGGNTWAVDRPTARATASSTGSASTLPRPSGLQAAVVTPSSACNSRRGAWEEPGWSST